MDFFLSLWNRFKHSFQQGAKYCILCHDSDADGLCAACIADVSDILTDSSNSCPLCFRENAGGAICGHCQKQMPPFEQLWASVYYEPPVSKMIHEFKHLADLSINRALAELMFRNVPSWLESANIDYVLPMPLSRERRLYRGFNQTEELVSVLAQRYGWTVLPINMVKRLHKPPQSTLKSSERLRNVKNIFELTQPLPINCNILLIDDVMTTGATLRELAKTLKKSGVGQIYCWTLARSRLKK